ncbi:hypothetical protein BCV02_00635 [Vibrio breoganii]|uniref:hypothetical protein n=1 Tax=Vibrio breoganii TaxID=553239 RepID=UPI000C829F52|nr:hypothetical protein [Vibrio breoganii]PMG06829.1 hypothetical protein BCV02_00635 [Vibrio breoganii]
MYYLRNTITDTRFKMLGQRPRNGKHAMQYVSMEWVKTNAPELLASVQHDIDSYPTHMCEGHVMDYVFQVCV